jgi:hypothetical protein
MGTSGPVVSRPNLLSNFLESWNLCNSFHVPIEAQTVFGGADEAGGITNGQEMVAQFMRENFPGPASETVIAMADVGDKGIEYTINKWRDTLWWLWQILKALTVGNGKSRKG